MVNDRILLNLPSSPPPRSSFPGTFFFFFFSLSSNSPSSVPPSLPVETTRSSSPSLPKLSCSPSVSSSLPRFVWSRLIALLILVFVGWFLFRFFPPFDFFMRPHLIPTTPFPSFVRHPSSRTDGNPTAPTGDTILPSSSTKNHTYILFIGDSVDMYFILDWCRLLPHRSLCRFAEGDRIRGPLYDPRPLDNCTEFSKNLHSLPNLDHWHQACSPAYCYDPVQRTTVIMFWQNAGVYPVPPFLDEITELGKAPPTNRSMTVDTALRIALEPIIRDAPILLGGVPDGIVFQSSFWEFYKLATFHLPYYNEIRTNAGTRIAWTTEWIQNMSIYTDIVKDLTQKWSSVVWYGTRTANHVQVTTPNEKDWRYGTNDIITLFNQYIRNFAATKGIGMIDFERITGDNPSVFLRDGHHPLPPYMVTTVDNIIKEVVAAKHLDRRKSPSNKR